MKKFAFLLIPLFAASCGQSFIGNDTPSGELMAPAEYENALNWSRQRVKEFKDESSSKNMSAQMMMKEYYLGTMVNEKVCGLVAIALHDEGGGYYYCKGTKLYMDDGK
ncbi:hypothetical protein ACFOPQ_10030 [Deinococcus antarcticus]|uniref:Uncharacterized protein n=1 Tax=Deinococcus antarcticus TaxID=1298767 RepID=A0ABV8A5W9_9DEIO